MKLKNKGKVYPSPSPPPETDALSVLKLLPAAIMAVVVLLSLEDREVLAYLISRSLNTTTTITNPNKRSSKKIGAGSAASQTHKAPRFDCECFDCYTSYWFRWDSSPSRELINQAIEAFEDHLASGEKSKSSKTARGKRRDKNGRREKLVDVPVLVTPLPEVSPLIAAEGIPVKEVSPPPERSEEVEEELVGELLEAAETGQKVPGRKMVPDVLGSIKSRIWGLWNPNV